MMKEVFRLDKNTIEMFKYIDKLIERNYPIDYRDCTRLAVREFVSDYELTDIYSLYGITYEDYIEDMAKSYLRYKYARLSEAWQKAN